ncbi:hypothetical protein [Halorarius halobius]|uniref:hypothetical protein n=1 Tax=Halorarius halobius TaxID=2962671 RepID=UPI0020CC946E|nr:hypothetical protein [Halorarius halobius]
MADIEDTRAVVDADETFDGAIMPSEQAELGRPVRVRERATVRGSVYGQSVEADPDAHIEASVMASDSVELTGSRVAAEVGCPGRVVAEGAHIGGTVTGKRVRLVDCIVRGNVVGAEVILENCVVLGIVTADRSLTVEDSLCYTVRSQGDTSFDGATLVLPQAIVNGSPTFHSPVSVAGLGELDVPTDDGLPQMDEDDLYERNETTYLTLAPRILDLEQVTDRLEALESAVMDAVDDTSGESDPEAAAGAVLDSLEVEGARPDVLAD